MKKPYERLRIGDRICPVNMPSGFCRSGHSALRVAILSGLLAMVGGSGCVRRKHVFDEQWCRSQIAHLEPVIYALQSYEKHYDEYPKSSEALVPRYLPLRPEPLRCDCCDDSEHTLTYRRIRGGGFQLAVTHAHWISSCNALVFRSSGDYPQSWKDDVNSLDLGKWRYVVAVERELYDAD